MGGHNMEIVKKPHTLHYSGQTMLNSDATATKVINSTNFMPLGTCSKLHLTFQ